MKSRTMILVNATFALFLSQATLAGSVKVIANSSVTTDEISADTLKKVFLRTQTSLQDRTHVEPVFQKNGPTHQEFLKEVLHQSEEALQTYYRTQVFTGIGSMPKSFSSEAEVIAYVARTKGAIGYVSDATETEGVKTLTVAADREGSERKLITRVEPVYPETLLKLQIGGTVRLKVTISPKGSVDWVELMGGNPILADAAVAAVKQWIYSPSPSRTITHVDVPFDPHR